MQAVLENGKASGIDSSSSAMCVVPGIDGQSDLRKSLEESLSGFVSAFIQYRCACNDFDEYTCDRLSSPNPESCIEHTVRCWVKGVCEIVDRHMTDKGHLSVSAERLPSKYTGIDLRDMERNIPGVKDMLDGVNVWEAEPGVLVDIVLKNFPIDGLYNALLAVVRDLKSNAIKEAAESLGRAFDLVGVNWRGDANEIKIKSVKGRAVVAMSYYRDIFSSPCVADFYKISSVSETMENDTGVTGLCSCVDSLISHENIAYSGRYTGCALGIPIRTKVNEGELVEAVVFKEKIEFRFMPEVFEALVGFIKQHSERKMARLEVNL